MADKLKILLLTSDDPQGQYDAIEPKDPNTLYLLSTGKIYIGNTPSNGEGAEKITEITNEEENNPSEEKIVTSKAIVDWVKDYVKKEIANAVTFKIDGGTTP